MDTDMVTSTVINMATNIHIIMDMDMDTLQKIVNYFIYLNKVFL